MSRAFLKSDVIDDPVVIPARAPLPPGTPNYVTLRGLAQLKTELVELETERSRAQADTSDESERTRQLTILNGRIANLNSRITSAKVVELPDPAPNEVRFGATVRLRARSGKKGTPERQFTIVGVDEASTAEGRVAFTAPIARAVQGRRMGEVVSLRTARGEEVLEVVGIGYEH
ncbi:MAG: GreA/GreB family elongation factor [Sphingobacteriaceae bacterium]|nr:GreA/GreB family elongation factor [Cytophagaceae bacterium]